MAQRSSQPHVKIPVNYFTDTGVESAGDLAEVVWVRALAFAAGTSTPDRITDRALRSRLGVLPITSPAGEVPGTGVDARITRLEDAGLLTRDGAEWVICGVTATLIPAPAPTAARQSPAATAAARELESRFQEFYDAYGKKKAPAAARRAWTAATKRATPDTIIAAAHAHAAARAGTEPRFVRHPATWLNADAWLEDVDPAEPAPGPVWAGKPAAADYVFHDNAPPMQAARRYNNTRNERHA